MPRSHYLGVATDNAGNALENAVVRVLQPGTTNPIADPIYATDADVSAMTNPFTTTSGEISFYLATPQRVRLGITPVGGVERFKDDIDIGSTGGGGGDSDHTGGGSGSTRVGLDSASEGGESLALGQQASASGDAALAAGHGSSASGLDATSVGSGATSSGDRTVSLGRQAESLALGGIALGAESASSAVAATAVGENSIANSTRATALGAGALGGHSHSTAVGSEAVTTEANQVILGTSADVADAPGGLVMTAVDGKRGRLIMQPDGTLNTVWHVPSGAANLLPAAEQGLEGGIGAWASVTGLTTTAGSTDYALSGTSSLKLTLSGAGAASARSGKVAAVPGTVYVARGRIFYHLGDLTAALNATAWLEFWSGADALIGSAVLGRSRALSPDTWIHVDSRSVAPAGTATVSMRVGLPTGGGSAAQFFYADQLGIFGVPGTV